MLTVGNLTLGLVALLEAASGRNSLAALLVLVGMVLDGLDGRAARLLHAESHFGKELDSLSDIVTFGVAPAFIMYQVVLQYEGFVGMAVAVLFPLSGALRLARFNVQHKKTNYFVGLPITAAGGILATMALYNNLLTPSRFILPTGMVLLSVLMVSKARYPNFKKVAFPRSAIVVVPVLTVVVYVLFRLHVSLVNRIIFVPLALYAVFGVGRLLKRRRRLQDAEHNQDVYNSELK
jgi:CDP-diacylglycerol--serine O-phosphatidyltransferase